MKDLELWDGRPVGDVAVFNLNRPMNMAEFDRMPADLQHEYLFDLRTKHGARVREIAAMLGCEPETVRDRLRAERIHYIDKGKKSKADQEDWEAFVAGYTFPERTGEADAVEDGGPSKAPAPTGAEDGGAIWGSLPTGRSGSAGRRGGRKQQFRIGGIQGVRFQL